MAMTLDELLALLPDNTTGAIDAADLRTIVTQLYDDSATLAAAVQGLAQQVDDLGGGTTVMGHWQANNQAGAVPGGQQVTGDSPDHMPAMTWLRFAKVDQTNTDMTNALMNADRVLMQQQSDSSNWARFDVTGMSTDEGSYVQIPVTWVNAAGNPSAVAWQAAVVGLTINAAG